ncbi:MULTISPECIES: hypothetical protein [unclassified Thalassotalea]|nr:MULTISPECIES: hypothetical protein [unclassified Thalassotalea]
MKIIYEKSPTSVGKKDKKEAAGEFIHGFTLLTLRKTVNEKLEIC